MRKIMPVFESRNYLCLLLSLFFAGTTAAAEEPEEAIARCAKIASVGERILCLENALREEPGQTTDQGVIEEPAQAAEAVAAPVKASEPASDPLVEAAEVPEATVAEPVAEAASDVETMPQAADASDIGAEQVEARTISREERIAALESATGLRVASYRMVPYERLVVELENGQVWRQIKGDVQRIRVNMERNQTVDITESSFGGYQLRLNEIRRTIRVQRIK
jgi:hypothetical protein